jgi:hypothetical protein
VANLPCVKAECGCQPLKFELPIATLAGGFRTVIFIQIKTAPKPPQSMVYPWYKTILHPIFLQSFSVCLRTSLHLASAISDQRRQAKPSCSSCCPSYSCFYLDDKDEGWTVAARRTVSSMAKLDLTISFLVNGVAIAPAAVEKPRHQPS